MHFFISVNKELQPFDYGQSLITNSFNKDDVWSCGIYPQPYIIFGIISFSI